MKISIISMQRVCNFGSVLQAYSLKNILTGMGHEVSFVDYGIKEDDPIMLPQYAVRHSSERDGWSDSVIKRYLNKINRYMFNRLINRIKQNKQKTKLLNFQQSTLKLNALDNNRQYDTCVIGSDEVFNCLQGSYSHLVTQLLGNVTNAKNVITYAASCGFTTYELLPQELKLKTSKALSNITAFSVRDKNTKDFVQQLTGKQDIFMHFDPVLIGNFDSEVFELKSYKKPRHKYCVVYSYANRIHDTADINAIKEFCKRKHLKLIALGFQQTWIPNFMVTEPFELLYLINNAEFVITDTFHGTIFSAKYAERFAIIVRESNKNKLLDLVKKLEIDNHVLSDINGLEAAYHIMNDKEKIKRICEEERKQSIEYFEKYL
ncbi:MAG: polysaccharide pyruvyl transferase family protein [Lachnospiraceae bacterium]|nr:polysaccharide pyruvyl transferase family protein [Lachnospiraceae bacterium]